MTGGCSGTTGKVCILTSNTVSPVWNPSRITVLQGESHRRSVTFECSLSGFLTGYFSVAWWSVWFTSAVSIFINALQHTRPLTRLLVIPVVEYWVVEANSSCSSWNWYFGIDRTQIEFLSSRNGPYTHYHHHHHHIKPGEWLMVAASKRDVRRINLGAAWVLVSFVILSSIQEMTFSSTWPHLSDGLSPPSTGCD